jgi:hypothetical protein
MGRADILVGIPSFNTAETVGRVVTAVETSAQRPDGDARAGHLARGVSDRRDQSGHDDR